MSERQCIPTTTGPYRYLLEMVVSDSGPRLAVIFKNPSRASVEQSDPTIDAVEAWARGKGFGAVAVTNLFALRSPQPWRLNAYPYAHTVGPENDLIIRKTAESADIVVVGWGNPNGILPDRYEHRIREVLALLGARHLHAVGPLTRAGYPRHGLSWNEGFELAAWR